MPLQLIYTSAPRGLVAGRSGFCVVARSEEMSAALVSRLEEFSHFDHNPADGDGGRVVHVFRSNVEARGSRYHVLSRIQDAGLDFTGRTNFIAHHLVFRPEETSRLPSPATIFRQWPQSSWVTQWPASSEPRWLPAEPLETFENMWAAGWPARSAETWARVAGDAVKAAGLLQGPAGGFTFPAEKLSAEQALALFDESLSLTLVSPQQEIRGQGRWSYSFTTCLQPNDRPGDFRWRRAGVALVTARGLANSLVNPASLPTEMVSEDECRCARQGYSSPRILEPAHGVIETQGSAAIRLRVVADGVPLPTLCQCSRDDGKELPALRLKREGDQMCFEGILPAGDYAGIKLRIENGWEAVEQSLAIRRSAVAPTLRRPETPLGKATLRQKASWGAAAWMGGSAAGKPRKETFINNPWVQFAGFMLLLVLISGFFVTRTPAIFHWLPHNKFFIQWDSKKQIKVRTIALETSANIEKHIRTITTPLINSLNEEIISSTNSPEQLNQVKNKINSLKQTNTDLSNQVVEIRAAFLPRAGLWAESNTNLIGKLNKVAGNAETKYLYTNLVAAWNDYIGWSSEVAAAPPAPAPPAPAPPAPAPPAPAPKPPLGGVAVSEPADFSGWGLYSKKVYDDLNERYQTLSEQWGKLVQDLPQRVAGAWRSLQQKSLASFPRIAELKREIEMLDQRIKSLNGQAASPQIATALKELDESRKKRTRDLEELIAQAEDEAHRKLGTDSVFVGYTNQFGSLIVSIRQLNRDYIKEEAGLDQVWKRVWPPYEERRRLELKESDPKDISKQVAKEKREASDIKDRKLPELGALCLKMESDIKANFQRTIQPRLEGITRANAGASSKQ